MTLQYKGKTEPSDDEALAELRRAVEAKQVVLAVIDDGKERTIYTNISGAEAIELREWLIAGGVLAKIFGDVIDGILYTAAPEGKVQ